MIGSMEKKKSKKGILIATAVAIGLILISYVVLPFWVYKPARKSTLTYDKEKNAIFSSADSVKILQLTDLHINDALDMPIVYSMIKRAIYMAEPDLVVITGDIFSNGCSKNSVAQFLSFMEAFKLPWACVLGNHDDETPFTLAELSQKIEDAAYSLFKTGNLTDLYGNYQYTVQFADGNLFQFLFMDSRSDGFTAESVSFYEQTVLASGAPNDGKPLNNFLFHHIPLPEIDLAVEAYGEDERIGKGELGEEPSEQENLVGFFDKVLELGATKALIYGHDHLNNAVIRYRGVDFCYGMKTGPSSYNAFDLLGGMVYTLRSNGEYLIDNLFV